MTPVIASDNIQLRKLVEEYQLGIVFEGGNVISLDKAISSFIMLSDSQILSIKHNCEKFTKSFSQENWIEKCERIYDQS